MPELGGFDHSGDVESGEVATMTAPKSGSRVRQSLLMGLTGMIGLVGQRIGR
jgi:hypothetical protein